MEVEVQVQVRSRWPSDRLELVDSRSHKASERPAKRSRLDLTVGFSSPKLRLK